MGGEGVLALDPGPHGAVQRVKALGGLGGEVGEPRGAQGAEEALDVSLSGGLTGAGVDERDAEQAQPVAHGFDGDAGAPGAWNDVGALGLLVQGAADVRAPRCQAKHVGDEAIAEQRHGLAQLFIRVMHR